MKRPVSLLLLAAVCTAIVSPFAFAAAAGKPAAPERSPMAPMATAISTVTGIAISPLLGTGAYGAYQWWSAGSESARAGLPWYAQIKFWLPALLVVGLVAAKDAVGAAVPAQFKKPLDVLEVVENKMSGLVAAGAVVPIAIDSFSKMIFSPGSAVAAGPLLEPSGLAMVQLGAFSASSLLDLVTVPLGIAVFAVVWLSSHAINVLILLSPWGAIDAALKSARTALLGLVAVTAAIDPWLGALLSLGVIAVAYFLSGWAFRLTLYGTEFCWDFLTFRSGRFIPAENDNPVFAGSGFTAVPVRARGRLVQRTEGGLQFFHRPWPWMAPRQVAVPGAPAELAVGRGLFFSEISTTDNRTLFLLPPRYRGHEETLARAYGMSGVKPAGLNRAWGALRSLFGGRAVKPAVT